LVADSGGQDENREKTKIKEYEISVSTIMHIVRV